MPEAVIAATARTPIGRAFKGSLKDLRPDDLTAFIIKAALEQVDLAIDAATVIILVVNVREGIVPLDEEVAARLRKSGKPVLVAANKTDTPRQEAGATEFTGLGFERIFPVSASAKPELKSPEEPGYGRIHSATPK